MKRLANLIAIASAALLAVGAYCHTPLRTSEAENPESQIRTVLNAQVAAWNRGDIPEYMNGYWKSDKLVFVGSSGVTRGWQATLDRYIKHYPDRKTMGRLTFSDLEIIVLNPDAAFVLGKWHLQRGGRSGGLQAGALSSNSAGEPPDIGGVFSLVLRKFPEGWRIIADHTSVVP
jgi:ketosteroid isomerase-like protein